MENSFREYERFQVSKEHNYCLAHHIWQRHSWQINHESVEYKKINIENSMNLCSYSWFLQCSVGMHLRVTSPLCCKVYKFPLKKKSHSKYSSGYLCKLNLGLEKKKKTLFHLYLRYSVSGLGVHQASPSIQFSFPSELFASESPKWLMKNLTQDVQVQLPIIPFHVVFTFA